MDAIHKELNERLSAMGCRNIHVTWDEEFTKRVHSLPMGPERTALVHKGLSNVHRMLVELESGDVTPLVFDDKGDVVPDGK